MCGGEENVDVVEVGAEVVEAMHWKMNCHSTSAQSSYTWSSSSAPWIAFAASTAPYPSCAVDTAPYTSCWPPRAAFASIHSVHRPDHGCPPHWS